jgi:hypothetical protein
MLRPTFVRLVCLSLLLFLGLRPAPAQEPVAVAAIQSIDGLLDTARYAMTMAGQADKANQLDGIIDALLRGEGFKGIDTKKPMGVYISSVGADLKPVAIGFLPITGEKDFLDFLGRLNVEAVPGEKGIRSIELPTGQKLHLTFEHNHVFVAEKPEHLQSVLNPGKLTTSVPSTAILYVRYNFDSIPAELRSSLVKKIDGEIAKGSVRKESEGEEEYQGRLLGMKLARNAGVALIEGSKSFAIQVLLDREKHRVGLEAVLEPRGDTPLAREIESLSRTRTSFAAITESAPASFVLHGMINETLRGDLNRLIDSVFNKAMEQEKSVVKKAVAEKVFKVLEPTLKSSEFDFAAAIKEAKDRKHMTGIAALRVKNGKQLEQLVRDFASELKEGERQNVKLDADKAGDISLHVIEGPPQDPKSREMAEVFGAAKITVAFHDQAVFVAIGQESTEAVKQGISQLGKTPPGPAAALQLQFHLKPFIRFEKDEEKRRAIGKVLEEIKDDAISVSLTGGKELRFRIQGSTEFLKLAKAIDKSE